MFRPEGSHRGRSFRLCRAASRSRRLQAVLLILAVAAGTLFLAAASPAPPRSNLLLITVDTLRPDRLGCYGADRPSTPHIDAMAESGALFLNAYAHNPLTLPSHVNLLVGTTPLQHGVHENSLAVLTETHETLAEHLKARGYATAAFIGSFSLDSRFGLAQGFDVYDDSYPSRADGLAVIPERPAQAVLGAAISWMEQADSPWFVWIHLWDPHAPYLAPSPYRETYGDDPYAGEVAYVDAGLGGLFDFMSANHLKEKTLMVFTGDHGEAFGEHGETRHGYFAYNTTLRVPLIVTGPGIPRGKTIRRNAAHIDVFPSICAWLGTDPPSVL
jgi:arylsulfatase A-like enzyme